MRWRCQHENHSERKKINVSDDDKDEKKLLAKHKNKSFADLTQAEKDELLLAALQRLGMAKKNAKIKLA